jgi:hypothetical protein
MAGVRVKYSGLASEHGLEEAFHDDAGGCVFPSLFQMRRYLALLLVQGLHNQSGTIKCF